MALSIAQTQTTDAFVSFGNGLYVGGWIQVWNATVDVYVSHKPGGGQNPIDSGDITSLTQGWYPFIGSGDDPITGFSVRSHTPGVPAQIVAYLTEDGKAGIGGGVPVTGSLSGTGQITGGTVVTGIIPATGTTPTAGTGFTYTHTNASGVYVFTFTTAFTATPLVLVTSNSSVNVAGLSVAVTPQGFTLTNTAGDLAFNFLAQAVT